MLTLLCFLFLLPVEYRVSASSGLLSWQLDTNNRSTWDIVWSCSSTIFACTWTIIHSDVPGRQVSEARRQIMCVRTWLIALLVPELILGFAFLELFNVINSRARYNAVQAEAKIRRRARAGSHGGLRGELFDGAQENSDSAKWTLTQTFCINAGGLALQTQDDWIYTVTCEDEMVLLIQSGMVSPLDLRERDIEEHAKQDWLGKLFTLLQVSWFICNIITRWASHVSVSPFELATIAYCFLGIVIYGFWWFKPKDMGAPIIVPLHYDRDNLPGELHDAMHSAEWTHRLAPLKEEHILLIAWDAMKTPFLSEDGEDLELLKERPIETPSWIIHIAVILFGLTSLSYCGVHIAAWDYTFPTRAEWISWIVFCFVAVGAVCIFSTVNIAYLALLHLKVAKKLPSSMEFLAEDTHWQRIFDTHMYIKQAGVGLYIIARLGIMALVCSSLRALPEDSYTTVAWVTSIPHF